MREIRFRGYATEKMMYGQWLFGTGLHRTVFTDEYEKETGIKEEWFIFTDSGWYQIHPESIGQYTGLRDKDGLEIYEGDILHHEQFIDMQVKFLEGSFVGVSTNKIQELNWTPASLSSLLDVGRNISGNVYENPDVLIK